MQIRVQAPVLSTPISDELVCRPDVLKAMQDAWEATSNGTSGTEAGFRIDAGSHGLEIVPHERTNEQGSLTTIIIGSTEAEFHVHPKGTGGAPSTPENNILGDSDHGDTKVADDKKIDIYTFNEQGLFVYRWETKQIVKLRDGLDWQTPCVTMVAGIDRGKVKMEAHKPKLKPRKKRSP